MKEGRRGPTAASEAMIMRIPRSPDDVPGVDSYLGAMDATNPHEFARQVAGYIQHGAHDAPDMRRNLKMQARELLTKASFAALPVELQSAVQGLFIPDGENFTPAEPRPQVVERPRRFVLPPVPDVAATAAVEYRPGTDQVPELLKAMDEAQDRATLLTAMAEWTGGKHVAPERMYELIAQKLARWLTVGELGTLPRNQQAAVAQFTKLGKVKLEG